MKSNSYNSLIEQNISYYNEIADRYNTLMDKENSNGVIRQWVQERFNVIGTARRIMDFGGGTGMDLPWLTGKGHQIYFCEPSIAMKKQAEQLNQATLNYRNLIFLSDDQADYRQWPEHAPLPEKVDALLANFAVINCVPDTASLFRSFAAILNSQGHLFALLLDPKRQGNGMSRWKWRLNSLISNKPIHFQVEFDSVHQTVFVHSIKQIKKHSAPYFKFLDKETSPQGAFVLIHLTRK
ncbi:MAG: hypothetical protein C5B59_17130 [Bacteroidetes bacterium]|nr:MAG: hypothetical protein C5B59_17130 [Bacteroidota bacterium]